MKKILIIFLFLSIDYTFAAEPVEVWSKTYNTGETDQGKAIAVDQAGNVYVAGVIGQPSEVFTDIVLLKYDSQGNLQFSKEYGSNFYDEAASIAVDPTGNTYLCGHIYEGSDHDGFLIKHSSAGDSLWALVEEISRGPGDETENRFEGVCADQSRVYVTGYYDAQARTCYTYIFDHDGNQLEYVIYGTDDDESGADIAVDGAGNCYVGGYTGHDYLVLAYDANLDTLWVRLFDAGDVDQAQAIALGPDGNTYTAGFSGMSIFTVSHSGPSGDVLWGREYKNADRSFVYDVAVDDEYYYVAGVGIDTLPQNIIGYIACFDFSHNLVWEISKDSAFFRGIALDTQGDIYVTGAKEGLADYDAFTARYHVEEAVSERPVFSSPVTLEIRDIFSATPSIHYLLPAGQSGTLTFYSSNGRKLESHKLDPNLTTYQWSSGYPAGVYFIQLRTAGECEQAKILITR